MKKVAVTALLSVVFVSVLQSVSFATGELNETMIPGAMTTIQLVATTSVKEFIPLPGGGYREETKTIIEPSYSGAVAGALAGAAGGAAIGSFIPVIGSAVGAGVGAIAGGIAGWIWGPAD